MAQRLAKYLEKNNILMSQQSGFRRKRRTTDNLVFHSQKVLEAFNKKSNVISLSFDIQAAFDAVWHDGLIFKMRKVGVPGYIVEWTRSFLRGRQFDVRVGEQTSEMSPIFTGVPQGSSLSPILFSIFINDIPVVAIPKEGYVTLYADDLSVSFFFKNIRIKDESVSGRVQNYLGDIEKWLCKWRMRMAPSKCNFTIFSKGNNNKNTFQFRLFGELIPHEKNPVSLGIMFDKSLNFKDHVKKLKSNCTQRLNIIKILSHKSWKLSTRTLISIYKALIGSVIDYSAFICPRLDEKTTKSIQAIQNRAMRSIFHRPYDEHTEELCRLSGLPLVQQRMVALNIKYFKNAKIGNPIILDLFRVYRREYPSGHRTGLKTLLCDHRDIFGSNL